MSDLNRIHSCSGLVKLKLKKPSVLVSGGKSPSSSIDVLARDTPGPSDPVPIAGDRGASYRPWRVAAMDHTVTVARAVKE